MKHLVLTLLSVLIFTSAVIADESADAKESLTFVLVHGATGGGWDWKDVANRLAARGHTVYRPTLSGLGERHHLLNANIDLTTHINDIENLLVFEELQEVILVGHSYGGMVLTGVMDKQPSRIRHAIFLDAAVPDHGMSAIETWGGLSPDTRVEGNVVYFSWLDESAPAPKDVPHPYKSITEPVSYKNPAAHAINATYVAFVPEGVSIEERTKDPSWIRAKARGWSMRVFDGDHVIYRQKPAAITQLLIDSTNDRNSVSPKN